MELQLDAVGAIVEVSTRDLIVAAQNIVRSSDILVLHIIDLNYCQECIN